MSTKTLVNDPKNKHCSQRYVDKSPSRISGYRRAEYSDLPYLERLLRSTTYEIFGDVELERLYETCCLFVVQYNERNDIVSGICLCNYPNVPSVPPCDWLTWLKTIYGIFSATERNTMFVHLLVWDERYSNNNFLKELLSATFDITIYCQHVILVVPPRVILGDPFCRSMSANLFRTTFVSYFFPADMFEQEMTRILAKYARRTDAFQFLYLSERQRLRPKLKIRRVVEEDNDDIRMIIDNENTRLRELYGEYYVSEMIRNPNSCRQLIIGEDIDGSVAGVMCLNCTINVDLLNENFELTPYNGLRKSHENDKTPTDVEATDSNESLQSSKFSPQFDRNLNDTSRLIKIIRDERNSEKKDDANKMMQTQLIHDVPTYHDKINVFVLEIFATREEMRPHWSYDLEAAFDCFPHLEYCAIVLPFSHPYYQFLQHFTCVPLRCNKDFPMTLYIVHRALLHEEIKCRCAKIQDRKSIQELLFAIPKHNEILTDFDFAMDPLQLDLNCFVFECNDTMVGLAIIRAEKQINLIKKHYHIEDYVSMRSIPQDNYGHLLHFVLMPIFSAYHRFFFREIARLSELTVIFYRLHHEDESVLTRMHPLVSCLDDMIPVNPRRQAEYRFPIISENLNSCENNVINQENGDDNNRFSLFVTSPRLAMMPRVIIDMRIVIVGASECGIAFAEYLALRSMQHYIQFTNVTLISPHGIPFDNKPNRAETCLLPFKGKFCSEYRRCMPARAWINIVYGIMTKIHRKDKYVSVMNEGNIAYDYLVLTCGLQYQKPILHRKTETEKQEMNAEGTPWNYLTINDDTEASNCLRKIRLLTKDLKEKKAIFFYGCNIDCYCALGGLIKFGIKPSWITLIKPILNPCNTHDFFDDCEVNEAVMKAILQDKVQVLCEWNMIDWVLTKDNDGKLMIDSVIIEKKGEKSKIVCDALFNFYEKTINLNAFWAIRRADLVFDGLLVIDSEFRTNDPFIFAAGTMTKYSKKLYAKSWRHKYYNSVEVGERVSVYNVNYILKCSRFICICLYPKLAQILRRVIDIHRRDEQVPAFSKEENVHLTLPVFRAPIVIACILPGNYYYLHVHKPGKKIRDQVTSRDNFYGEVLVTGSCTSEIGYFRIKLNVYDSVETITCINRKIFRVQNMISLYGKHESMLNELKFGFRNSYIADFYAYFREPWAEAIFHDKFECLRVENRATLLSQTDAYGDFLIDDCMHALIKSKWKDISEKDRRYIEYKYAGSIYHRKLEDNLLNFLEFHEDDLPMYCTPQKQRQMYVDIEESPLYFKQ
ncbi:LOW QUALITY PROTEIN: cilia- and flagella-associated protein 61-like [Nylanderia fulva]|uniref:LOW QUALITY PROTEIN: cilia- and flagella-associated protein 61-like n=1 Tax=Nylanderia fulva TaxID=613905 RepID=UPI0010FB1E28|nr:LOW QUALITY PROTEIN: cilia- and flagella-associated protein 61-like [Nylanderia fulva]